MKKISVLLFLFVQIAVIAQQSATQEEPTTFSLKEAIDYGLNENFAVKNSSLQRDMANAQQGEVRSMLLPQIAANADLIHSFKVQQNIQENGIGFFNDSTTPRGTPRTVQFGLKNIFTPTLTGYQVLYDQSFFSAQGAAKANKEIADKNSVRTRIDVTVNITKAYYGVLVNEKQLLAIESNLARLDSLYQQATARYESGLVRTIDVSRTQVSLNNMREQQQEVIRMVSLSRSVLRYQLNVSEENPLILTDSLYPGMISDIEAGLKQEKANAYRNRIEYSIIESQEVYNRYQLKAAVAGHYPRLLAIGSFGYNPAATDFADLGQSSRWYDYSTIGLRLQVPIFSGFSLHYKIQQKKIQQKITENDKHSLEKEINLEVEQALINLHNSVQSFNIQKENLKLAQQNLEVLRAEYEAGIALNVEVTTAESDLIEAQTNYYRAVYNALVSKADYEKAIGTALK